MSVAVAGGPAGTRRRTADPESVAGRIRVRVRADGDRIESVSIDSSRRTDAATVLENRSPEQALAALPLLFSVCGMAQAAAGVAAIEQAQGRVPGEAQAVHRELCVLEETAREHALRLVIDWPQRLGLPPAANRDLRKATSAVQKALRCGHPWQPGAGGPVPEAANVTEAVATLESALAGVVFGRSPTTWLALRTPEELLTWARSTKTAPARALAEIGEPALARLGRSTVAGLPDLAPAALDEHLARDDGTFRNRPTWDGDVYETGPLARQRDWPLIEALKEQYGNGLITRLTARLVELARLPARMRRAAQHLGAAAREASIPETAPGHGIAAVEAARGRLVHRVVLDGERVAEYRILAPTEWNFHPRGALALGLEGASAPPHLGVEHAMRLAVTALDPCVDYRLEVQS